MYVSSAAAKTPRLPINQSGVSIWLQTIHKTGQEEYMLQHGIATFAMWIRVKIQSSLTTKETGESI